MSTPRVVVTEMSNMPHFLYFQQFCQLIFVRYFPKTHPIYLKKKFHLIVEEYDGEALPHDETNNMRKLLKGGDLISSNIVMLAQLLLIKKTSKIKQKRFLKLCLE